MAENIENNGCSLRDNAEHEGYVKASRSFNRIWKERDSAQPRLLEAILYKDNFNRAYKRVKANKGAPPVRSCHTHRSLSSEKCWDSKNNGRRVQSSHRFPYTIRCFSIPQGWVSYYRRILISFRAFQDHPQEIR